MFFVTGAYPIQGPSGTDRIPCLSSPLQFGLSPHWQTTWCCCTPRRHNYVMGITASTQTGNYFNFLHTSVPLHWDWMKLFNERYFAYRRISYVCIIHLSKIRFFHQDHQTHTYNSVNRTLCPPTAENRHGKKTDDGLGIRDIVITVSTSSGQNLSFEIILYQQVRAFIWLTSFS